MEDLILRLSVSPWGRTEKNLVTHTEVTSSLDCHLIFVCVESLSVILAIEGNCQRVSDNSLLTGNLHKVKVVQGLSLAGHLELNESLPRGQVMAVSIFFLESS